MPASLTFPGVYIEELSSGVHTITGVATSIAAFVGWADQGPTDEATLVQSWTDYEAQFGGLDSRSYLGYAVNQFFANGGQQAYIVRVVWDGSQPAAPGTSPVPSQTARSAGIGLAASVITATAGAIAGNTALTVGSVVLQSIALTPAALPFLQVGQTLQLKATGTNSDGTTPDVTNSVTWTSGSPAVATVTPGGLVTAIAAGTAMITATQGAVTANTSVTVSAAVLTGIAVSPLTPSIAVGQTQQFTAKGTYSDATSQDLTAFVTWSSSDAAKASIGAATGLAKGLAVVSPATITATLGATSGNTTLTVGAAALVSVAVTPANAPWLQPGATQQFKATGTFTDGTTQDLTPTAAWTSANPSVATVDATGKATAVAVGSSAITATSGASAGSATLTVTTATLSSIAVTPVAPSLAMGLKQQLTAIGTYSDTTSQDLTQSVVWSSADATKATVDANGLVTAVAAGTTSVSATLGKVGSTNVTVTPAVLQSIAVTPANPAIASGATQQFTATGTFSDATTQNLTNSVVWNSGNPAAATITAGGLATAVAAGGTLTLFAANPGEWGNHVQVGVTAAKADPTRFSLQVQFNGRVVENFTNLSTTATDPQYVVTVIENDSQFIAFIDPATKLPVLPGGAPASTAAPVSLIGGADGTPLVPASDQNFELALLDPDAALALLDRVDIFNILCVPAETDGTMIGNLQKFCHDRRAFYIVDSPQLTNARNLTASGPVGSTPGSITGQNSINSAYYFPWVQAPDPLFGNRPKLYPPCGFVTGIYAGTDTTRGVWKAPAGIDASLTGVSGLQFTLTDLENGSLNIQAINCLREFKVYGDVVWGARTLQGNDQAGSEWKYVPIRRLALFLESSLYNGTKWVVFEPNDERLWGQIRLNVGAFMQGLFLQGAFQGSSPQQAFFVKCDGENNPQASIDLGIVNVLVGFAPLFPAEFVVIQIQQLAGQLQA